MWILPAGPSRFYPLFMASRSSQRSVARLFIVCGLPGAGKTTLARSLTDSVGALRLSPDEWMFSLGIDLFDSVARDRIERLQWEIEQRLLEVGQSVIIEWGTWARAERDALRQRAREMQVTVELRYVDTPIDVIWERIQTRDLEQQWGSRSLTREDLEANLAVFEVPDEDEFALYDVPV